MTGLASALLALAGLFAERAVRAARRPIVPGPERRPKQPIPRPLVRGAIGLVAGICLLLVAGPAFATGAAAVTFVGLHVVHRRRVAGGRRREEEQLAETVAAIAAGLRAGQSLSQSLAYARDEADRPIRDGIDRLVARVEVGMPVGEAVDGWAAELDSDDARLVAGVLDLHRRNGGDLPSVLDGLGSTLRDRRAAHREIRALTAQARLSGVILGVLPIGFFAFLLLTSSREMLDAISTPLGRTTLAVGLGLEGLAFLWIRRLLEVR